MVPHKRCGGLYKWLIASRKFRPSFYPDNTPKASKYYPSPTLPNDPRPTTPTEHAQTSATLGRKRTNAARSTEDAGEPVLILPQAIQAAGAPATS